MRGLNDGLPLFADRDALFAYSADVAGGIVVTLDRADTPLITRWHSSKLIRRIPALTDVKLADLACGAEFARMQVKLAKNAITNRPEHGLSAGRSHGVGRSTGSSSPGYTPPGRTGTSEHPPQGPTTIPFRQQAGAE